MIFSRPYLRIKPFVNIFAEDFGEAENRANTANRAYRANMLNGNAGWLAIEDGEAKTGFGRLPDTA